MQSHTFPTHPLPDYSLAASYVLAEKSPARQQFRAENIPNIFGNRTLFPAPFGNKPAERVFCPMSVQVIRRKLTQDRNRRGLTQFRRAIYGGEYEKHEL
jgi:hypothetical protein